MRAHERQDERTQEEIDEDERWEREDRERREKYRFSEEDERLAEAMADEEIRRVPEYAKSPERRLLREVLVANTLMTERGRARLVSVRTAQWQVRRATLH